MDNERGFSIGKLGGYSLMVFVVLVIGAPSRHAGKISLMPGTRRHSTGSISIRSSPPWAVLGWN
jgi:hypothetical protein